MLDFFSIYIYQIHIAFSNWPESAEFEITSFQIHAATITTGWPENSLIFCALWVFFENFEKAYFNSSES